SLHAGCVRGARTAAQASRATTHRSDGAAHVSLEASYPGARDCTRVRSRATLLCLAPLLAPAPGLPGRVDPPGRPGPLPRWVCLARDAVSGLADRGRVGCRVHLGGDQRAEPACGVDAGLGVGGRAGHPGVAFGAHLEGAWCLAAGEPLCPTTA